MSRIVFEAADAIVLTKVRPAQPPLAKLALGYAPRPPVTRRRWFRRVAVVMAIVVAAGIAAVRRPKPQLLVPLALKLPKPAYLATPVNFSGIPNLPPMRWQPRAPFMVPPGTTNVALNKPGTSSDREPVIGQLSQLTDGDKEGTEDTLVEIADGRQWVQIDLQARYHIHAVVVWHDSAGVDVPRDVVVQLSDDPDFISHVHTIFNNDHDGSSGMGIGTDRNYVMSYEGKLIDATGIAARYVRIHGNGRYRCDEGNVYREIEVYGTR